MIRIFKFELILQNNDKWNCFETYFFGFCGLFYVKNIEECISIEVLDFNKIYQKTIVI